jgi:hypothetical protein
MLACPFGELHLARHGRLDPGDPPAGDSAQPRCAAQRRGLAPERLERLQQLADALVGEAAAAVPGVLEVVGREQQSAEPVARALAARVTRDQHGGLVAQLDLAPVVAAATRSVAGGAALGHDALEAAVMGSGEQRLAVVVDLREDDDRRLGDDQPGQQLAPPAPRLADQRLAVELEQVEDHVRDRSLAPLEQLEARDAVLVERAQLAVEDASGVRQGRRERLGDVTVRPVQPLAVA